MIFSIDTTDIERLRRAYAGFSDRRFRAGLATALTRAAVAVREAQQHEMRDSFDRPTPRTLGALFVEGASAQTLVARVGIADQATSGRQVGRGRAPIHWLRWQIYGGQRSLKGYERRLVAAGTMPADMRTVPGREARLDAFGNISAGQIRQILSQLRIELSSGATSALPRLSAGERKLLAKTGGRAVNAATAQAKSQLRDALAKRSRIVSAYRRAGGQFVAFPNGRGKLRPGVYLADRFNRQELLPVLLFVTRASYEAGRYDFEYTSTLAVRRHLSPEVNRAMAEHLQRMARQQQARS